MGTRAAWSRRAVLAASVALPFGSRAEAPGRVALPEVRPRSEWGASPPKAGGRTHTLRRIALHHTAGPQGGTDRAPALLRGIQLFHQRDKGWVDLAYHLFVDADGVAWEGRDLATVGDTATAYDPSGFLLVCALGNFEEVEPTPAQLEGLARVLAAGHSGLGLSLDDVAIHRELAATLCPGAKLAAQVPALLAAARAR